MGCGEPSENRTIDIYLGAVQQLFRKTKYVHLMPDLFRRDVREVETVKKRLYFDLMK